MVSWLPENISTYGGDIDSLFVLIYYIVGVWFIATEVLLIYFILRYRRREGQKATYVRGDRLSELAWVLVPAAVVLVLDLGIEVAGGPAWARIKENFPEGKVQVRVTGKQFNWEFRYPGPDAQFDTEDDLVMDNELHVPVNQDVRLTLEARDVLHSFFLPNVRLKQDAVPGRSIPMWFNATKTGSYELACAELCGFGHYTMRGELIVHSPEEYQKWVAERWPPPGAEDGAGDDA